MRRLFLFTAILACLAPAEALAQRQLTLVLTVATDGTDVSALTPDDLRIIEDGADCRIVKIESAERRMKLQVLVDNGQGMGSTHGIVRDDMLAFVQGLPEDLEVTLVTTSPRPRVRVEATATREELLEGVEGISRDSGAGQFTKAVLEAAERIAQDDSHIPVILMIASPSDSNDVRDDDIQQMRERLRGGGATVHVLMYADLQAQIRGERQIQLGQLLAQETGGRFELLQTINLLEPLLTGFAEQLASASGGGTTQQIRVTFERPDGKTGELGRMQMAMPDDMNVLATAFE